MIPRFKMSLAPACVRIAVLQHAGAGDGERAGIAGGSGDGLDHGDTALLAGAMRELRARARAIVWLNPLLGDARYRPEAAGMRAALPFVDHFGSAHNLASLEGLLRFVP